MIRIGQIANSHGINGELKIMPLTDDITRFKRLKNVYVEIKLNEDYQLLSAKSSRIHKDMVLLTVEEITDKTTADKLKGKYLCVKEEDAIKLPEGRYFIDDLLGCSVFDADSDALLGEISDISPTGANDVWHITKDGKEYLVPAIAEVLVNVDIENEKVIINRWTDNGKAFAYLGNLLLTCN